MFTRVKTPAEIENMRLSGQMLATVLASIQDFVSPGATEKDVVIFAEKELKALGGEAPFKGYQGFPDAICISTNDAVVHGIAGNYEYKDGDVASFDMGVTYKGMVTDSAFTMVIGKDSNKDVQRLLSATKQSLEAGIAVVKNDIKTGDIGAAVEQVLAQAKLGIVRELVGHGVGHEVHEQPDIPNYGRAGLGETLKTGMTIAIEPMATLGSERIMQDDDGWTIHTQDGSLAAHFEHTVLITDDGYEVITQLKKG